MTVAIYLLASELREIYSTLLSLYLIFTSNKSEKKLLKSAFKGSYGIYNNKSYYYRLKFLCSYKLKFLKKIMGYTVAVIFHVCAAVINISL